MRVEGLLNDFNEIAPQVAKLIYKSHSLIVLGKGFGEAIAHEISLKIKEVSYIHSEAYNASTFKHGPLAIINPEERTPSIILILDDEERDDCISTYQQLIGRNSAVICITNCEKKFDSEKAEFLIKLPNDGDMSAFYAVFAGQLIAYYTSLMKGYNPDKPRNLSKEITTK